MIACLVGTPTIVSTLLRMKASVDKQEYIRV